MADEAQANTSLDVDLLTKPIGENQEDTNISIDKERDVKKITSSDGTDTNVAVDQEETPPEEEPPEEPQTPVVTITRIEIDIYLNVMRKIGLGRDVQRHKRMIRSLIDSGELQMEA